MTVETMWFPEPYIRLIHVSDSLADNDVEAWVHETLPILDAQSEPISFILDLTATTEITANIMNMPAVLDLFRHPKFAWLCVVGTTPLVSFWMELLNRSVALHFKVFSTVADAQEFLLAMLRIAKGSL